MSARQDSLFPQRHNFGQAIKDAPAATLTLFNVSGVGSARFRALLGAFGSPAEALKGSERALKEVPGVDAVTAGAIHTAGQDLSVGEKLFQMLSDCDGSVVSIWDEGYPRALREIHDPPALLFLRGAAPQAGETCVAIVGTRTPSLYGMKQAHVIASELAARGVAVVSGMARGVDTAGHEGALQGKGRTFAIFGCGIDVIYPSENKSLAEKIIASGGLISEFLPGTPPDPGLFPRRNRIISGLSRGVLVVQGSEKSGALITARCALEQNREVFALPGNVEDRRSRGPHLLLREGAILVENADDILRELGGSQQDAGNEIQRQPLPALNASEETLVTKLSADPIHIDQLVRELERPVSSVLADLLDLEMKGWVVQTPGKLFALKQM
jgi:DNA processing protein